MKLFKTRSLSDRVNVAKKKHDKQVKRNWDCIVEPGLISMGYNEQSIKVYKRDYYSDWQGSQRHLIKVMTERGTCMLPNSDQGFNPFK